MKFIYPGQRPKIPSLSHYGSWYISDISNFLYSNVTLLDIRIETFHGSLIRQWEVNSIHQLFLSVVCQLLSGPSTFWLHFVTIAVVTLQPFYLGKHDLLTVYLGKLDFLSVTDFSLGNLPRGNFIVWVLDMSRKQ